MARANSCATHAQKVPGGNGCGGSESIVVKRLGVVYRDGHELRSAVLCERHAVDVGAARVQCALRSSAPQNWSEANLGELATRRNGPAVGDTPVLSCGLQQLAPAVQLLEPSRAVCARTPSSVVGVCVRVHERKARGAHAGRGRGRLDLRGAAAQTLQQGSAVTTARRKKCGHRKKKPPFGKRRGRVRRRPTHILLRTRIRPEPSTRRRTCALCARAPRPLQPEAVADGLGGRVQLGRQLVRVDDGPHPLPARLRVAERAHGVVDGRVRARRSLELGDPALQLGNLPLGGLQLAAEERVRRLQVLHALQVEVDLLGQLEARAKSCG